MMKWKAGRIGLLIVVLLLAACSSANNASESAQSSQPSASPAGTKQETAAPEPKKEPVTLHFWIPGPPNEKLDTIVKDILTDFQTKNPHVTVEHASIPWAEYFQKLSVAYAGNVAPDVHGLGFGQLISTVNQDQYMNLTPFIEADPWDGMDDFYPSLLEAGQWEGGLYGLIHADIRSFSWRKDMFRAAGLDPEKPPRTIDELFEYADKLKIVENGRTAQAGIDIPSSNGEQAYMSLAMPLGLDYYDEQGHPTFDSADNIALIERVTALFEDGAIVNANNLQLEGVPFGLGIAAMGFPSGANINAATNVAGAENVGVSLPPAGPDGKRTAFLGGTFITMSKTTKHPEEAWALMKHWFEPENLLKFSVEGGFVPARQSLKDQFATYSPYNAVYMETLADSQGYKPSASWAIINKHMRIALEEAYFGVKPVKEAMESNAAKARNELGIQ